jgi:uncharacterized protein YjiS (DUF1127 family)
MSVRGGWRSFVQCLEAMRKLLANFVGRAYAAWRRGQRRRATCASLRGLDSHTLRDLGITSCEISSVAAEIAGAAEATRARTCRDPE